MPSITRPSLIHDCRELCEKLAVDCPDLNSVEQSRNFLSQFVEECPELDLPEDAKSIPRKHLKTVRELLRLRVDNAQKEEEARILEEQAELADKKKLEADEAERLAGIERDKAQAAKQEAAREHKKARALAGKKAPYTIADGKALTCRKGLLAEGDEIKVEYLAGGQEQLDDLIRKEFIDEN